MLAAGMALYSLMLVGMEQGDLAQAVILGEEAHRPFPPLWEQQVPVTRTRRCGVLRVDEPETGSEPPPCGRKALRSVENSGIPGDSPSG